MIHAEEKLLFREVHQQRDKILSPPLNFNMVALAEVVNADVNFRTAWHPAGHFFTHKEVRVTTQGFGHINRIVVRHRDDRHAQFLAAPIDLVRLVVGFLTNAFQQRSVALPEAVEWM